MRAASCGNLTQFLVVWGVTLESYNFLALSRGVCKISRMPELPEPCHKMVSTLSLTVCVRVCAYVCCSMRACVAASVDSICCQQFHYRAFKALPTHTQQIRQPDVHTHFYAASRSHSRTPALYTRIVS